MVAITDTEGECIPIMIVTFARTLPLIMLGACLSMSNMRRGLERQWAEDVLLGAESGPDRDGVVRWRRPVTFLVVDAEARFRTAIDRAFVQLEQALDGVHAVQLEYVGSQDRRVGVEGYVTVFAKAPAEAAGLAADLGVVSPAVDADGWFTITWNDAYELTRGLVFINPDLEQRWLRHTALEELFQALGPSNDSGLLGESLLYESEQAFGSSERLARVDREVLKLLYGALRPGSDQGEIRLAMLRTWHFPGS